MGCTSSTQNMSEITANTNENTEHDKNSVTGNVKDDEDEIQDHAAVESDTKDTHASQVLPTCDSLEDNIQLARNSSSFTSKKSEEQEQEQSTSVLEKEEIITEDHNEHKLSLQAVADQVLLQTIFDDLVEQTTEEQEETNNNKEENVLPDTEDKPTELVKACSEEQLEDEEGQEVTEASTSPSQSDGNRSTRWEALADIAAELPPSLAVDPVTGQIYSLTK
ncbi:uncharacterized protein LOC112051664 [Bicyclus anynana]|uniref:Uncharacterized protein LOC112051664 n=1 Tax=Bicyclus anynana TaxID=110368 RepID=A0A6J1NMD7_BICAN|nr:uncharacterized protein LOC112051664 [Bicyclus anynana]